MEVVYKQLKLKVALCQTGTSKETEKVDRIIQPVSYSATHEMCFLFVYFEYKEVGLSKLTRK